MGEEIRGESKPTITEVGEQGNGRGSTKSESTPNATAERGRRGERGDRGERGTTEEKEKVVSRLSSIKKKEGETDEQYQKRLERNEKRRQKYQEQKAQGTLKQAKPKKVNAKKKQSQEVDTEQLNTFIKTISTLIASRPNCSHWLLSDTEIESITTPLAKMFKESDVFNKLGEHSNQIALITACITVFMPRIITTKL